MLCGGLGNVQDATAEVQQICDEVKPYVEEKAGKTFDVFTAKTFKTQVVAGKNYFIKVYVGGNDYIHLRVYQTLPHAGNKLELHSLQTEKNDQDQLAYF
ncbi:cystatin-B-like [Brienomyrus brachyistius]|uniref:cystatin-B-like n=1 Tax=Brienomyrus brachyistius TaxID=42636 RepID=UPI0020B3A3BD|nr:cystatin-B-like [Brienomyrus brachyistius]